MGWYDVKINKSIYFITSFSWFQRILETIQLFSNYLYQLGILNTISSSSSCRAASMDLLDPLQLPFSIVHRFRWVFHATPCIGTELLYVGFCWSSCLCSSMWWSQQKYVTYEFVPTSPVVSHMSGSSNLDSFRDRWPYNSCFVRCCL